MPEATLSLDELATRRSELRSSLLEAGDKLRELRAMPADRRGDTYESDVRAAISAIHTQDPELVALERIAESMVAEARAAEASRGPSAAHAPLGEARSAGHTFVESDEYRDRNGVRSEPVEVRTLLSTETSDPAAGLWMPVGTPIPPQERRARLFVRDLLSTQTTTLNSVPYLKELNPATNETGASSVAEGAAKPEVTMQFVQADAPVRKIAAWLPVTEEVIADAPTLRGYIDTRLAYMLALREELEILSGNGVAPDLTGILNTSGIQTQAFQTDVYTTVGLAMSKIETVDGYADGIAMNPSDFWTAATTRNATQFDGGFGTGAPFGTPSGQIWGLPVVRTRSLSAGVCLVGAFRIGATLFDREQTTIRTTDSHSDYFIYNKLVILAEERVALAVHRPDFFVNADVSA